MVDDDAVQLEHTNKLPNGKMMTGEQHDAEDACAAGDAVSGLSTRTYRIDECYARAKRETVVRVATTIVVVEQFTELNQTRNA